MLTTDLSPACDTTQQRIHNASQPLRYCVVSHTHWDREWYLPFEQFRRRLVDLIDHVLEILDHQPDYIFHLDAQTIVLEDYLEIRPHRRDELSERISQKRLLVGPWYIQNDFFLTSGEATVRNLLIGSQIAREFGYCSNVGYVPDQFGLIGQLPQIFRGFGIEHAVFGRGHHFFEKDARGQWVRMDHPDEILWESPDGSTVFAVHLSHWYNNAQRFPDDPKKARQYLDHIHHYTNQTASTPLRLLMNGVDHLEAQENLLPILARLNEGLQETSIVQTSLESVLRQMQTCLDPEKMPRAVGELRDGKDDAILQGTLSSRAYLKKSNVRAQALLENQLEPLYTILCAATGEDHYPADFLDYLWKLLLKNHPHDSICGCSRDAVHADMENRFARFFQCGEDLLASGLKTLSERIARPDDSNDGFMLTVFNTLPFARTAVMTATVRFPLDKDPGPFALLSPGGENVDYELLGSEQKKVSLFSPINLPGEISVIEHQIRFTARAVPGLGYQTYWITPAGQAPQPLELDEPEAEPYTLENDLLRVSVSPRGCVTLHDKTTGATAENLIEFLDQGDLGDSYNFKPAPQGPVVINHSHVTGVAQVGRGRLSRALRIDYRFDLPAAFNPASGQPSAELVEHTLSLTLRLDACSDRLDIDVRGQNVSRNHRLRLLVHTGLDSDLSWSATPFDRVQRDRRDALDSVRSEHSQPNSGLIAVSDGQRSLTLFNEGLYEYEHMCGPRGTIALTLVRATGMIANFGDQTSPPPEEWMAPENQSLRPFSFRLALRPGDGSLEGIEQHAQAFQTPLLLHYDAMDPRTFSGGRPCVQSSELSEIFHRPLPEQAVCLPPRWALAAMRGADIVLSALKESQDGQRWIMRFYNPSRQEQTLRLEFNIQSQSLYRLNLDETHPIELGLQDGGATLSLHPGEIMTLAIKKF